MHSYTKTITVEHEHLDELNHVNNVVYLQWVQDIAKEHWFSKTEDDINNMYVWVVVKHELEYKRPAFLNDELSVTTYVEDFKGALSVRCVDFKKGEDLIVSARSQWCMIGAKDQRPKRVPKEIFELFLPKL
ncbi:MAG: acyl-CoA thioesterase [Cytophagales bacterium]|nr:acyl-CoA thioesterase [Cytophagales bacterium]